MNSNADIEALWHSHHHKIRDYIRRHIYHVDDAQDVLSNVYLRALVAMTNGNGYTTSASGWIWQITRSVIYDYWRMRKTERGCFVYLDAIDDQRHNYSAGTMPRLQAEIVHDKQPLPHEKAERALLCAAVRAAIARLSPPQAEAITLRLDGYSNDEIAAMAGVDATVIRQRSVRAFRTLRELLKEVA